MVCANPECKFCTTEAELFHECTNDELTGLVCLIKLSKISKKKNKNTKEKL